MCLKKEHYLCHQDTWIQRAGVRRGGDLWKELIFSETAFKRSRALGSVAFGAVRVSDDREATTFGLMG